MAYKRLFEDSKKSLKEEYFKGDKGYKFKNDDVMYDLEMNLENDGDLYRQQFIPIIKNIQRKIKLGKYDHKQALKLWMYYVENGAKKFAKDIADYNDIPEGTPWNKIFDKSDRMVLAQKLADFYYDEIERGNYDSI